MDQQAAQSTPVSTTPPIPASPVEQVTPAVPAQQPPASSVSPTSSGSPTPPQDKKSSSMWIIILVIIAIILGVGGWFIYQYSMNNSVETTGTYQITPTAVPPPTEGAVKSGDAQLDQQSEEIDASMMELDVDLSEVDKGLNDKADDLSS